MSETVFYIRGEFPFGASRGISEQLISDVKVVLAVAPEQLAAVACSIEAFQSFMDKATLLSIVASTVKEKEQADKLARLIFGIDEILRSTNDTILGFLGKIEEASKGESSALSHEEVKELRTRLPLIIKAYAALERQAKARRLAEITGSPLEDIQIICDLRPIFDTKRQLPEGMIPFTTLRVVCKGVDGLPIQMEALMSEKQVAELAKKATGATEKLKRLREFLAKHDLAIPKIEITKTGE